MRPVLAFGLIVAVAGCMETQPPAPHPAMVQLQSACDRGDTEACAAVLAAEQRGAAIRQAAGAQLMQNLQANQRPVYTYQMPTTRQTTCMPGYNGVGMNCTSY